MKKENLKKLEKHGTAAIKDLKNDKGITLIALVITVIVLLILAGITVNALTR